MTAAASAHAVKPPMPHCWSRIGISGDRSCPELETHVHCRNCPVFAGAARDFFDRSAPPGYLSEWTDLLAREETVSEGEQTSVVLFRLDREWLALDTSVVAEVTAVRPVHRIPHRSNDVLAGLVNLRGQLYLCASLGGLLGIEPSGSSNGSPAAVARMVVIRKAHEAWVFQADEVLGVRHWPTDQLAGVPSTLANPAVSFSKAVFHWQDWTVGILDADRVFAALRSLGS
jgi:chemotaxis-related protein WspD